MVDHHQSAVRILDDRLNLVLQEPAAILHLGNLAADVREKRIDPHDVRLVRTAQMSQKPRELRARVPRTVDRPEVRVQVIKLARSKVQPVTDAGERLVHIPLVVLGLDHQVAQRPLDAQAEHVAADREADRRLDREHRLAHARLRHDQPRPLPAQEPLADQVVRRRRNKQVARRPHLRRELARLLLGDPLIPVRRPAGPRHEVLGLPAAHRPRHTAQTAGVPALHVRLEPRRFQLLEQHLYPRLVQSLVRPRADPDHRVDALPARMHHGRAGEPQGRDHRHLPFDALLVALHQHMVEARHVRVPAAVAVHRVDPRPDSGLRIPVAQNVAQQRLARVSLLLVSVEVGLDVGARARDAGGARVVPAVIALGRGRDIVHLVVRLEQRGQPPPQIASGIARRRGDIEHVVRIPLALQRRALRRPDLAVPRDDLIRVRTLYPAPASWRFARDRLVRALHHRRRLSIRQRRRAARRENPEQRPRRPFVDPRVAALRRQPERPVVAVALRRPGKRRVLNEFWHLCTCHAKLQFSGCCQLPALILSISPFASFSEITPRSSNP